MLIPVAIAVQQVQLRAQEPAAGDAARARDLRQHRRRARSRPRTATRCGLPATSTSSRARSKLPFSEIDRLRWAGRLHDLGKVAVDAIVLRKPGRLDGAEWAAMRRHPRLSARLLQRFEFVSAQARAVELHHERMDGARLLRRRRRRPAARVALPDRRRQLRRHDHRPAVSRGPVTRGSAGGDRAQYRDAVPSRRREGVRGGAAGRRSRHRPVRGGAGGAARRVRPVQGRPRRPVGAEGASRARSRSAASSSLLPGSASLRTGSPRPAPASPLPG